MTPLTNVYGVARSLLSLSTLSTLAFSDADSLFKPAQSATVQVLTSDNPAFYSLFALLRDHLEAARWLAVILLCVVASGWRPRYTGILHWWITASFFVAMVTPDGGDQCASVLALLLVPATLCDSRKWHWTEPQTATSVQGEVLERIAASSIFMARLQVAILYLHAATGKFAVPEWVNGTALYYWLLEPAIGIAQKHQDAVLLLLQPAWVTPLLTWTPIALELALFCAIGMSSDNRMRRVLLYIASIFHIGNLLFFGLFSFMLTMFGALVLLLRPASHPYRLQVPRNIRGIQRKADEGLSSLVDTGLSGPINRDRGEECRA